MNEETGGDGHQLDALQSRRRQRELNRRTALDRRLTPAYTAPGLLLVTREGDEAERDSTPCDVGVWRLDDEDDLLVINASNGTEVAGIAIARRDLKTLLRFAEGKEVKPDRMRGIGAVLIDRGDEGAK